MVFIELPFAIDRSVSGCVDKVRASMIGLPRSDFPLFAAAPFFSSPRCWSYDLTPVTDLSQFATSSTPSTQLALLMEPVPTSLKVHRRAYRPQRFDFPCRNPE